MWRFNSAFSIIPPNQTSCVAVIPEVCRRYWWKIASSLIRYNYPPLCIFNLQTSEQDTTHSKHITQRPLLAGRATFFYMQSMGKWRGSSFDAVNFNISVPRCTASEHTLHSGAKQDSLSPLGTLKADSGCGGGAGCLCNKTKLQKLEQTNILYPQRAAMHMPERGFISINM